MAKIRLEGVTKIYKAGLFGRSSSSGRSGTFYREFQDKAFAERVTDHESVSVAPGEAVTALDHLSLTIRDGETMAVVGPSGCGKSTLLRVIAGLEPPGEGSVYYDGKDMKDVPPKDRGIGMVFQSYALYPQMKGEGNLGFFFKVRHRTSEEMMERIRITSEIMGIGFNYLLSRKPRTLSGGQQQRVAIGRCIVRDPSLFLFDEPLSNLDAKLRTSTRIEIKRLLHRFAITSIYVTHDQTEAITLGDRIAVMRAGKIEQLGTYQEILADPVNAFVAGFLGLPPMNLLRGWTVTSDGKLRSDMGQLPLPKAAEGRVSPGQSIVLGFRSEGAHLVPEGEPIPEGSLVIMGEALNAEPNFARHFQTVHVQAGEALFGVQASLDMPINTGWKVQVVLSEEGILLFDEETEARIH